MRLLGGWAGPAPARRLPMRSLPGSEACSCAGRFVQWRMADPTPDTLRAYLAAGLPCEFLEVDGDGRHFFATIVSTAFEGLPRVRRHQRVYEALGDRMREEIHALSMKTLTPAEFAAQRGAAHPYD